MIWFDCCGTYGRALRSADGTKYVGRCGKCGRRMQALIGEGGTEQRMFRAVPVAE